MRQKILFYLFFVWISNHSIYCQNKVVSKKEVSEWLEKGHDYFRYADFENSLKTLRVALFYSIQIKNDTLTASIYNRIARNFGELYEPQKALIYFEKSLLFANKSNDLEQISSIYNNIGDVYSFDLNKPTKAISFYKKAIGITPRDTSAIITPKLNLVWTYFDQKQFDLGYNDLQFITKHNTKFGDVSNDITICMLNGMFASHKNDTNNAFRYFKKGLVIGKNFKLKDDLQYLHQEYAFFLNKNGNHKLAYQHLLLYQKIEEEFYKKSKLQKASIAGINFELDEFKREIDKIEHEKKDQAKRLKSSKTISFLLLLLAIIFGLLLFLLYRNIRNKIKSNKKLATSNVQLQQAKELAEEASKIKSQFVSTITHELRTPLYGVIGMTDILQDEHKELEENPHIKSLKFSAQYLLSLVNDILKINKLEENVTILEKNQINLHEEIEAINNSLSFLVQKNKNKLSVNFDFSIPKNLCIDKLKLTQVLINLIGNSLKFTKNGEVTITVLRQKIVENFHFIEFRIKDNGTGIAKEDQEKIFEKFVQISRKEEDYQGTGLGLAIVKKLLDLFKSEIKLESAVGVGTTFSFVIPFEKLTEGKQQIESFKNKLPEKENYKILVVEDNKINQVVTRKIIEKSLGICVIANDGFEAIEILEKQTFDIILMDINMPEIDGYQTTIKIRETNKNIPIIALTASSKDQIRDKATTSGMNDIIVKPFEPIVLYHTIKRNIIS